MVDGTEGEGSLKAVGGTHGVSPYWYYGGPSCVHFYRSGRESRYPGAEFGRKTLLLSCVSFPFVAHQLAGARRQLMNTRLGRRLRSSFVVSLCNGPDRSAKSRGAIDGCSKSVRCVIILS